MASTALEEKINQIRLRNEEIKRRYEEVQADKKNAAELEALERPVPIEDWPERKEPPEFSSTSTKNTNKPKQSARKHNDQPGQYYSGGGEGRKTHVFADGQGPPPDPKYNFLADSEREENASEIPKDTERNRGRNKTLRGSFKRRGSGRDWHSMEHWNHHESPRDKTHPEYEAWRAERNRIDEARISRQRTAEGNWRREWDNDKIHLANDITKHENVTIGDVLTRQEYCDNDNHYRAPRTMARNSISRESQQISSGYHEKMLDNEKRLVIATEKSIKVLLNSHGTTPPSTRSPLMSVKVSSANIAGTGRVGPRQRPRVMYSQSEVDSSIKDGSSLPSLSRQKSLIDETPRVRNFDQTQKIVTTLPHSPHRQRRNDGKSSYTPRRDNNDRGSEQSSKVTRRGNCTNNYSPKSDFVKNDFGKSPRAQENISEFGFFRKITKVENNESNLLDTTNTNYENNSIDHVQNEDKESSICENNYIRNNCIRKMAVKDDNELSGLPEKIAENSTTKFIRKPLENSFDANDYQNFEIGHFIADTAINDNEILGETQLEIDADPKILKLSKHDDEEKIKGDNGDEQYDNSFDDENFKPLDEKATNCSANNDFKSNDSGFIELPSNDNIHDVSDNCPEKMIEKENSSDSMCPSKAEKNNLETTMDSLLFNVEKTVGIANASGDTGNEEAIDSKLEEKDHSATFEK